MTEGKIIKALSGFYYVQTNNEVLECRGRGLFRKKNITPLVGDLVVLERTENQKGYITEIKPRKNKLDRPPIANIDQGLIVCSAKMPDFSAALLDRFLVLVESKHITPIIVITKIDLLDDDELDNIQHVKQMYEEIGYDVELVNASAGSDLSNLEKYFANKITTIIGQSGVGKSSLLNAIHPSLEIKTDEISVSLGRGKHTTRHVELIEIGGGLVADTPGFSLLDLDEIETEELAMYFPEMNEIQHACRFRGCLHHKEPHCAVKQAVEDKTINQQRYNHYLHFLNEISLRKPRY